MEGASISVDVAALLPELRCPICMGILRNTYTVMECLHRFCKVCIEKVLRSETKHICPSCRRPLGHRRSLRKDANYDALVALLAPEEGERGNEDSEEEFDLSFYREEHNRKVLEMQRRCGKGAEGSGIRGLGIKRTRDRSRAHEEESVRYHHDNSSISISSGYRRTVSSSEAGASGGAGGMVNLRLSQHRSIYNHNMEEEDSELALPLQRPFLRLPATTPISTLRRYVQLKLALQEGPAVRLSVFHHHQRVFLDDEVTLFEICSKHWDCKSELNLYFFVRHT